MADNANAQAAGNSGTIDVTAITKSVTESVLAALRPSVEELAKNQKIFVDTYAADKAAAEKNAGKQAADEAASDQKPLGAQDVAKLVADALAQDRASQQKSAAEIAARKAFAVDPKNGLANLPARYQAALGNDPAKWPEEAKAAAAEWQQFAKAAGIKLPDVGGANREGGDAAVAKKAEQSSLNYLPENLRRQAAGIVLPAERTPAASSAV